MIRFRAPAVRDAAPVVALAPIVVPDFAPERDAGGAAQALEQFFDRAFPVVDCCLRRLLRALEVDFDSLNGRALRGTLELALASLSDDGKSSLADLNENQANDPPWSLELCAAFGATRVALETLGSASLRFGSHGGLAQLQCSLAGMPGREAEFLVLVDLLGHTTREIGALLGLPKWRVRSYLARGRRRLRQCGAAGRVAM